MHQALLDIMLHNDVDIEILAGRDFNRAVAQLDEFLSHGGAQRYSDLPAALLSEKHFVLKGTQVEEAYLYLRPTTGRFTIIASRINVAYRGSSRVLPRYTVLREILDQTGLSDLCICPECTSWVMALTHEDQISPNAGPFLAYRNVNTRHDFY